MFGNWFKKKFKKKFPLKKSNFLFLTLQKSKLLPRTFGVCCSLCKELLARDKNSLAFEISGSNFWILFWNSSLNPFRAKTKTFLFENYWISLSRMFTIFVSKHGLQSQIYTTFHLALVHFSGSEFYFTKFW